MSTGEALRSALTPFTPFDVLALLVVAVLALTYLAGSALTAVRIIDTLRGHLEQRRRARSTPRGAPARIIGPSWWSIAVAAVYGLALVVVWPGVNLAYRVLGDRG